MRNEHNRLCASLFSPLFWLLLSNILSGGQWLAVLIGFKPLPGSLQAAPIAMSYGWTEVSLSLRMGLRLKWNHHLWIAWAKSLAVYRF